MRQQPRPLQRAPSAPAVDPSTLDTLPMFHDFLEGSSPTKPDEGVETGEKSHGLADLPHGEVNSDFPADLQHGKVNYDDYQLPADLPHGEVNDQLLAEAGVHGDAMEPKTPEQPESDLPDQPCPRTLDQPLASDAKSLHDEPEPLAPQNVVTENAEGEHGGAVAPEDTKEGGEEPEPADGPEDLFNAEVQTTRHEQFEERDRLAKEAPMTKKQAKAAAAKKKKADDKEKAKLAKENSKALAKAKAKFQKERAKAEKLAAKLAAKADKKMRKKLTKKQRLHRRRKLHRSRRQQRDEKTRARTARRHMMRAQQRPRRFKVKLHQFLLTLGAQRSKNPRSPAPRRPSKLTLLVMTFRSPLRQAALPPWKLLVTLIHRRSAKLRICQMAPMIPRRTARRRQLLPGESVARVRRQESAGTTSRESSWTLWPHWSADLRLSRHMFVKRVRGE